MLTEPSPDNTSLLVLCGGQGLRMQGQDKPLLTWRGQPLVAHVVASVPWATSILISANRNLSDYASHGRVVCDADMVSQGVVSEEASGPLVGICAGLHHCATPWLLVSPGDTPTLPDDWSTILFDAWQSGHNAVVAHDRERQQHLHLLLHRSVLENLIAYLTAGHHQVFRWLETLNLAVAHFSEPGLFKNLNSPEDWGG